jgi:phage terminase large subunit GpA-like protein
MTDLSPAPAVVSPENGSQASDVARRAEQVLWLRAILAAAFTPAEPMAVDEWADGRIVLSKRSGSRLTGPLRLDRTPYMRGPLRAFKLFKRQVDVWSPQTGKTTVQQCLLGYCIDQDPGPMMFVLPSKDSAKRRSSKHLIPMLEETPTLAKHLSARADDTQLFQYMLDVMTVNLGWAGSATMLASEAVRYLICDESAKFKHFDKSEAHPLDLAEERTSSYDELARVVHATTPTLENAPGWRDLVKSTWHEDWVPCQVCGKPQDLADVPLLVVDPAEHTRDGVALADRLKTAGFQVLRWENIRWNHDLTDVEAKAASARYVCEYCGHAHEFSAVLPMVRQGKWVPRFPGRETFGTWLPSWYRGDVKKRSWNNAVKNFLLAAGDPELLQSHMNNDRCEPWREMSVTKTQEDILAHKRPYAQDTLPFVPLAIFCTVDLRAAEIHYVVRAWGVYETSALLRYGVLPHIEKEHKEGDVYTGESLLPLDPILEKLFVSPDGQSYGINATLIDARYDTDEVYAYCRARPNCFPGMGVSINVKHALGYSKPEKDPVTNEARADSVLLITASEFYFMDALISKMAVTPGNPGEWMLHSETGSDYAQHLAAKGKIQKKNKRGQVTTEWHTWSKHNHWCDCEYWQIAMARFCNIRDLPPPASAATAATASAAANEAARDQVLGRNTSDFVSRMTR